MVETNALVVKPAAGQQEGTIVKFEKPKHEGKPGPVKMDYDRMYVTKLPGRSRAAFVRKRRVTREYARESPFGLASMARALFDQPRRRRSYSVERTVRVTSEPGPTYVRVESPPLIYPRPYEYHAMPSPAGVTQQMYQTYPGGHHYSTPMLEPQVLTDGYSTRAVTQKAIQDAATLKHQCDSCGKYRSASYNSRHPLAPGEIPKSSTCRSCIRKHTSSDTTDDESSLRRRRRGKHSGKYRVRRRSSRYLTDSSWTSNTSSLSEEDIHVIRRARSLSRDRRRLRSVSTSRDQPRVEVTINPQPVRSTMGRRSLDPVEFVERRREYIEHREPSPVRSLSRGSSHYYEYSDDEPLHTEYRTRDYGSPIRRTITQSYEPRRRRIIHYGYDGDLAGDSSRYGPIVHRRRSESVIAQQGTPYKVEREEVFVDGPRRRSASRDTVVRRDINDFVEYDTAERARRIPTRSARVIRVPLNDEVALERRRGRKRVSIGRRSVSFPEGGLRRERSTSRHFVGSTTVPVVRRHRTPREVDLDSSEEYYDPGSYPLRTLHYTDVKQVIAPAVPRERYISAAAHEEGRKAVRAIEGVHLLPSRTYDMPTAPVPRHVEHVHTYRSSYKRDADDGRAERKYVDVPDRALFYRDV